MQLLASSPNSSKRVRKGVQGFTAIELMVVVAIVAVLAAFALPSFDQSIKKWQRDQAVNALTDTIYLARSEAVKYGGNIRIERLPNSAACSTSAAADWSCGWQIRLTAIPTGAVGVPSGGVLKRVQANQKNNIMANSGATINLNQWGNPSGAGINVNIQHKNAGSNPDLDKPLCLSTGGRLRQASTCS